MSEIIYPDCENPPCRWAYLRKDGSIGCLITKECNWESRRGHGNKLIAGINSILTIRGKKE